MGSAQKFKSLTAALCERKRKLVEIWVSESEPKSNVADKVLLNLWAPEGEGEGIPLFGLMDLTYFSFY